MNFQTFPGFVVHLRRLCHMTHLRSCCPEWRGAPDFIPTKLFPVRIEIFFALPYFYLQRFSRCPTTLSSNINTNKAPPIYNQKSGEHKSILHKTPRKTISRKAVVALIPKTVNSKNGN